MPEGKVGGEQLSVKNRITLLSWGEFLGEETEGQPGSLDQLLQHRADVCGGRVDGQGDLGGGGGVDQGHSSNQGGFGSKEGNLESRGPNQGAGGTNQGISERLEDAGEARNEMAIKIDQTEEPLELGYILGNGQVLESLDMTLEGNHASGVDQMSEVFH